MRKLTNEEIGKIGLYEFQGYIGAMTSPTFGGWKGTDRLIELLGIERMEKPRYWKLDAQQVTSQGMWPKNLIVK